MKMMKIVTSRITTGKMMMDVLITHKLILSPIIMLEN